MKLYILAAIVFVIHFTSCTTQRAALNKPITGLKFIGEYSLPVETKFSGTVIGGLSGIDYAPAEDLFYLISDDRSDTAPARFYTAKISLTEKGISSVRFNSSTTLRQKNGEPYPNKRKDPYKVPDPEALRLNHTTGTITWSSEGERIIGRDWIVVTNPSLTIINAGGQFVDTLPLPQNMQVTINEKGPRQNGAFEGLAFADNYKTLYVSLEEPLYEDGPRAGLSDSAAWVRIIKYDVAGKKSVAQYAYKIDPVVQEAISSSAFKINGVTDILAINDHQLLVTERSFSTGRLGCNVRVYVAELNGAEDVADITSLNNTIPAKPMQKTLLYNMDRMQRVIDNVEGATFGPVLPNGRQTLLFVTDNNFSASQKSQFLLFEVMR